MAQDPKGEEEGHPPAKGSVNTSHSLDTVALYRSSTVDAEFEADIIRGLLDSHGIPSLMQRAMGYPSLGFEVLVPRGNLREAERIVEEAKAAGPAAAMEAEQASEEGR
jgi:hypothetical protein